MSHGPIEWNKVKAFVFDAYGTLFDVHSAAAAQASLLEGNAAEVSRIWRQKQLEYSWLYTLMGRYSDFQSLTERALEFALAEVNCTVDQSIRTKLLEAYLELNVYPEVPQALRRLRRDGMKLAILTNGSPDMIIAVAEHAGVRKDLDHILSVDEVKIFKPHAAAYQLACDRLSLDAKEICFVSSNSWDVAGAAVFGFPTIWVNRNAAISEVFPGRPRQIISDLSELRAA